MLQRFLKLFNKNLAEDLVPSLMGKTGKKHMFSYDYLFTMLYAAELARSR